MVFPCPPISQWVVPQTADFKLRFNRDFPYGGTDGDLTKVQDQDIINALQQAGINIRNDLAPDQATFTLLYLLLAAHYLVINLRNSSQGTASQYSFLLTGKSAGSVNSSHGIPEKILNNPYWNMLCRTGYGAEYVSIVWPQTIGQVMTSFADAHSL